MKPRLPRDRRGQRHLPHMIGCDDDIDIHAFKEPLLPDEVLRGPILSDCERQIKPRALAAPSTLTLAGDWIDAMACHWPRIVPCPNSRLQAAQQRERVKAEKAIVDDVVVNDIGLSEPAVCRQSEGLRHKAPVNSTTVAR